MRPTARSPSFLIFSPSSVHPSFITLPFPSVAPYLNRTGDIAQLNLPVGMNNLKLCETEVTGKATSE